MKKLYMIALLAILFANSLMAQKGPEKLYYTVPTVPESIKFGGETIDLKRADRYERMDREMIAFSYAHSVTLLMIKRSTRIFPQVEPILKECGVPDDLKYLMVIESNLDPEALSAAGAAGLWQFLTATGRQYGLEVNDNIDERYNIEKATRSACKYLLDSYEKYGNWMTVAASYNAGMAGITGKLNDQKADNAMDLWLVEETSRYMFRILTAKLFLENPEKYGFWLEKDDYYPYIAPKKTVTVTDTINDLATWAKEQGTDYFQLHLANPWLRETSLQDKSHKVYNVAIPR